MALIDHIDGEARFIYLSSDTMNTAWHPVELYREVRALRSTTESLRMFSNFMRGAGNVSKGGGKATERYFTLLEGTRIVPYDASHVLDVTGTLITDDGYEGAFCFDKSSLSVGVSVDIQYAPKQVEVIVLETRAALTPEEHEVLFSTSSDVWENPTRELTSAGAGGATAQEVWEFTSRTLTENTSQFDETAFHSSMDSYGNKDAYKADVSNLSADVNVVQVAGGTVNHIDEFKANLTQTTEQLEDLQTSVDDLPLPTKVNENEMHNALDTYANKDDYKADITAVSSDVNIISVTGTPVVSVDDFKASSTVQADVNVISVNGVAVTSVDEFKAEPTDLTTILDAIALLNDVTAAEVRAAFDPLEFKDKNTQLELHTWLDSYGNKEEWKDTADITDVVSTLDSIQLNTDEIPSMASDITAIGLETFTTSDRTQLFGLENYTALHSELDSYANKDDWKDGSSIDLSGIPADVWAYVSRELTQAVGMTPEQEAKLDTIITDISELPEPDQMTEAELHAGLNSYGNKDDWKADVASISNNVNVISVDGTAVVIDDFKAAPTDLTPVLTAIEEEALQTRNTVLAGD